MKSFCIILLSLLFSDLGYTQSVSLENNRYRKIEYKVNDSLSYAFSRPRVGSFIPNIFRNVVETPRQLVKRENLKGLAVVAATSAVFIYYDQDIVNAAQKFGKYIGLSQENNTYNLTPWAKFPINVPTDLSSGMYYVGDGIAELGVNASFYIYGQITNDSRALRTACELSEGIATVGIYIQLLKHLSGHETPEKASVPGGRWRFFTSPIEYAKSVPKYDAFPSGHLATAMVTITIISMNYPEYRWIKPMCYTLMGICGYQMLNNGVHWMGDYPLAIAMGYTIGKLAVNRGRTAVNKKLTSSHQSFLSKQNMQWSIRPYYLNSAYKGLAVGLRF